MVTPAQLLAKYQTANTTVTREAKQRSASDAKEARRVQKAEDAAAHRVGHGPVTWVCTYCGETYDWPEKPDPFDMGSCDKNPDRERGPHNWARK